MNRRVPSPALGLHGHADSELYRQLLDRQPSLVCCCTPNGQLTFANAAARQYFNLEGAGGERPGNFFDQLPASERARVRERWQQLSPSQPECRCEHPAIAADGQARWHRWHYCADFAANGHLQSYHIFGDDIHDYRDQLARQVEQAENYQRALFASLPVSLAIADQRGRILDSNAAFDELRAVLGEGDTIAAIAARWRLHSSDGQPLAAGEFAPLRALQEQRAITNLEVYQPSPVPEQTTWLSISAAPIPLEGHGVAIACSDITPRKRTDSALRQNQATMQALIDAIPDAIWRLDGDGRILDCHIPAGFRSALPPAAELLGRRQAEVLPPAVAAINLNCIQQALQTRQPQVCEYELPIGPRTARYETRAIACGPQHVLELTRDISDRKAAEEALREGEQRFRAIFEQAAVGMALLTLDGRFFRVNQRFCALAGYTPVELLIATDRQLTAAADRAADREAKARLIDGDIDRYALEKRYQHRNGTLVWAHVNMSLVQQEAQQSQYLLAVIQDISHRKAAEQQLHQQAARERLVTAIAQHIHESLHLDDILTTTVAEVRPFLDCDRVLICRFPTDQAATVVAESVQSPWPSLQAQTLPCSDLPEACVREVHQNQPLAIEDVSAPRHGQVALPACYQQFLDQFQARAHLVVPIAPGRDWARSPAEPLPSQRLWGLLAVQHCRTTRLWQSADIDFLARVATQVGIAIQQSQLYEQLTDANRELQHLVVVDSLTQIANRRCFDRCLTAEWQRLARRQQPLALVLCDIEDFKRYNDTYGHPQGDACLQQVAALLRTAATRAGDLVARYGGEEFAIVLPGTDLSGALRVAEAIQAAIAAAAIPHISSRLGDRLSLSLGVACQVPQAGAAAADLLAAADRALYRAKAAGRDRYCY